MPRKFLHPGLVVSQADGDRHYIDARMLAWLHGVSLSEVVVVDADRIPTRRIVECFRRGWPILPEGFEPREDDVHLGPERNGDYPAFRRNKRAAEVDRRRPQH